MSETSSATVQDYSVPREAEKVFLNGIIGNPLIVKSLPGDYSELASKISFRGSPFPSVPINWRFAESVSALKGCEALFLNALLTRKYNLDPQEVVIDTDHAQLFFMSSMLWQINDEGEPLSVASFGNADGIQRFAKYFRDCDIHSKGHTGMYRTMATNIYKTKDDRYFHLHGSMNPEPSQSAVGVPHSIEGASFEDSIAHYVEAVGKINSKELDHRVADEFKQAGTICNSTKEYLDSEHGRANAHVGLWEVHSKPNSAQPPCWWQSVPETSALRPLAGLKVVDLTRIIAAPAVTRGLAEMGASVMRVTAEHQPDLSQVHPDLNWGKWNTSLDFRKENDREALKRLIMEADVVVSGYRPGVLSKYGFDVKDIISMCSHRQKGIIVVQENCYGWNGPWADRAGWQQISDANCGVSLEFGRAMGLDEPVTPVFPNSDYCTGIAGVCGTLSAILKRAEQGGSYKVDIALNYYSQWLVSSVGTYPPHVWDTLWSKNGKQVFRHYQGMLQLLPSYMGMLFKNSAAKLFKPTYFMTRPAEALALGKSLTMKIVKPVLQFPKDKVRLGYNVSTRGNGIDAPKWPKDLMVEIVI